MKWQFVLTNTTCQTEILALLGTELQTHLLSKSHIHKKNYFLCFHKNMTCLNAVLLRMCQIFSVSCKIVCLWVTTNCCFMSSVLQRENIYFSMAYMSKLVSHGDDSIYLQHLCCYHVSLCVVTVAMVFQDVYMHFVICGIEIN